MSPIGSRQRGRLSMKDPMEQKFLVVAPDEVEEICDYRSLKPYVYRIILAKPCPQLLDEIAQVMRETKIYGILTRGSLAQYLYANRVPVPIFDLKYELCTILDLLDQCVEQGYRKICIFEIGSGTPGQKEQERHSTLQVGEYSFRYSYVCDRASAEQEIRTLWESGQLDVVVGDVEPIMAAQRLGIPCRNFIINEQAYCNTVKEAQYVTETTLKEQAQDRFISVITNIISEAVIIADEAGRIQRCNLQAEGVLARNRSCATVQELFHMELEQLLQLPANQLVDTRGRRCVLNVIPHAGGEDAMYAFVLSNVNYVENMELSIRQQNQARGLTAKSTFRGMVCRDPVTQQLVETAKRYAKSNGTIIIHGETGTGKEVIASSIHNESLRANGPFVAINCATFNENLIESELFGYEKGAFTGALPGGKQGLFELAHRGSLFLDEIGELPLALQAKLLRVLQEKEVMRIGGSRIIPVDVRIIAATNRALREMVAQRIFREDLYYRLALLELELPPLRHRKKDIIPLFTSFLAEASEQEQRAIFWDDPTIFEPLLDYDWPGNIRELRNFSERVILLCGDYHLDQSFLEGLMRQKRLADSAPVYTTPITPSLKDLERDYVGFLLKRFEGNKEAVCSYLKISKATLWRKLERHEGR